MRKFLIAATALSGLLAFAGSAPAADLAVPVDPVYDWTGVYIGANIGWAWLDPDSQAAGGLPAANLIQPESDGISGGGRLGYNWQMNQIVFGVEGDFNLTDLDDTDLCFNPLFDCNARSDWNASIRARLGFAADRALFFATGGYAIADYQGFTQNAVTRFSDDKTADGWTVGAGVEFAWTDNVLISAEYRHSEFGKENLTYDIPYAVKPIIDTVQVGLSWKF